MKKLIFLAGIAALAMPVAAYADRNDGPQDPPKSEDPRGQPQHPGSITERVDMAVEYDNVLNAKIDVEVSYDKHLALIGGARVNGNINVNSSAVAVSDPKQIIEANLVASTGANSVNIGQVGGNGNIGVNAASGQNNQQANIGAIATAPGGKANDRPSSNDKSSGGSHDRDGNAGWAEASTVSLQKVFGNAYAGNSANNVQIANVAGDGNVGVNAASGAFNNQQNVLTMAVVKDGALAEANAGVLLVTAYNVTLAAPGSSNTVGIGHVGGNGNIGVNAAAGVGNVQHNSLTIATSN